MKDVQVSNFECWCNIHNNKPLFDALSLHTEDKECQQTPNNKDIKNDLPLSLM